MRAMGLPELLVIVGVLVLGVVPLIGLLILYRHSQQKSLQRTLIEKIASAHDFAEFLKTPGGQQFLNGLSESAANPAGSILKSMRRGVVIVLLGVGFMVIGVGNFGAGREMIAFGILLVFLGAGFLISAAVSHKLAKSWRLFDKGPGESK